MGNLSSQMGNSHTDLSRECLLGSGPRVCVLSRKSPVIHCPLDLTSNRDPPKRALSLQVTRQDESRDFYPYLFFPGMLVSGPTVQDLKHTMMARFSRFITPDL